MRKLSRQAFPAHSNGLALRLGEAAMQNRRHESRQRTRPAHWFRASGLEAAAISAAHHADGAIYAPRASANLAPCARPLGSAGRGSDLRALDISLQWPVRKLRGIRAMG